MDDIGRPQRVFVLALVIACYAPMKFAAGAEESSSPLRVGSKFTATDTLACGIDSDEDTAACIKGLSWQPKEFSVELQPAQAGCGDYLVRFPSPRPIGSAVNDLVAMEWFAAHDGETITTARPIIVVHESARNMTVGRMIARGISGQGLHA